MFKGFDILCVTKDHHFQNLTVVGKVKIIKYHNYIWRKKIMRFFINNWPQDVSFEPDESWIPIKEPTNLWIIQLVAIPFLIINFIIVSIFTMIFNIEITINIGLFFLGLLLVMPIHEAIHAVFFPEPLNSSNVKFGFFPKQLIFFAFYTNEMRRNRFALVLIAPFMIITLFGLLLLIKLGGNVLIENILIGNALISYVDTLGLFLLLKLVPSSAIIRNKEIKTYWKLLE